MSIRNLLSLLLVFSAFAFLSACGGSGTPSATAPASGGFSKSSLSGTYVFSTTGSDFNGGFLAMAGTFQADGNGGISGGTVSLNGVDAGAASQQAISSGSYTVGVDGRGLVQLPTSTVLGTITLDFVLDSTSGGLVSEFDTNGSGSGTLDLQTTDTPQGSYAFSVSGISGVSGSSQLALEAAGNFTISGTSAGIEDINSSGSSSGFIDLPLSGSVTAGTTPGTATLVTSVATWTFDVYMVDASHLKLVQIDGSTFLAGDAYTQATAMPTGVLAYTMTGLDGGSAPMTLGGFMNSDGSSAITAGLEDVNDAGTTSQVTGFTGSFTPLASGRTQLTLNNINNGAGLASPTVTFAAYPSSGGLLMLEIDGSGLTSGVALLQSSTALATPPQGYGLNLTGTDFGDGVTTGAFEVDDIAELQTTTSAFTGLLDENEGGSPLSPVALNGQYTVDGTGRGSATVPSLKTFNGALDFNFYIVDSSTILLMETDVNQVGIGSFHLQNPPAVPGLAGKVRAYTMRPPVSSKVTFHPGSLKNKTQRSK